MLIEQRFPNVIGALDSLQQRFLRISIELGITQHWAEALVASLPQALRQSGAFLDKMTGLWRYEFGHPLVINGKEVLGTHMWIPVRELVWALDVAHRRLPAARLGPYLARLDSPMHHYSVLAEMIPARKVTAEIAMDFEVQGLGPGNTTVDWLIHANKRVLLDVKRRTTDLIQQLEQIPADGSIPAPTHRADLIFRSGDSKFIQANPELTLQGLWIFTDIKQPSDRLMKAFNELDHHKVHFAVLGDWESDAEVLAHRPEDAATISQLFGISSSERFTFKEEPPETPPIPIDGGF